MARKRTDKKIAFLEPNFKDILVCRDKDSRPYLEIFVIEPENISQQGLGTLFGIFEINDDSEDSSYVVNYLISIIKKEYFAQVKRGPIESFEAALHKTNLALAKLAEHGQVNWIGKLNAVCAVCEKNNIHLAQTGTASAFLVRAKNLMNISGEQELSEDPNPLKTFQEVVSGRMENKDKVILTTDSLFNIFSLEEIKRSALKFSQKEFTQFLHTALVNELDRAAVLVVDVKEKEEEEEEIREIPDQMKKVNAFSQQAFARKSENKNTAPIQEERQELIAELKKELEKSQDGFVDEKTGHIYIKDSDYSTADSPAKENYIKNIYQRVSSSSSNLAHSVREKASTKISSFSLPKPKMDLFNREPQVQNSNDVAMDTMDKSPAFFTVISDIKIQEKLAPLWQKIKNISSSAVFYGKTLWKNRFVPFFHKTIEIMTGALGRFFAFSRSQYRKAAEAIKKSRAKKENSSPATIHLPISTDYVARPESQSPTREEKRKWFEQLSGSQVVNAETQENAIPESIYPPTYPAKTKNLLPNFSRIKTILSRLDNKKKTMAVSVVLLLIIVPYFISKAINKMEAPKEEPVTQTPTVSSSLENEKNLVKIDTLNPVFSGENIIKTVNVNGKIWTIGENNLTLPEENKSYDIPSDFQKPDLAFEMDDLNLILLVKNKAIIAFSVNNGKFQSNNITFPEGSLLPQGRSYLTYAYFLDTKNNQIYRYPRAEGGFGEKINWLKDDIDLSKFKDMAVNDNVFITDGKNILELSRGKKQDFNVESVDTPISISKLYTKPDTENLYILDRDNKRILKLGKDGNIISQYYNSRFGDILDFSVNEQTGKIYVSGSKNVESFDM